jgi:hypothetical protein
VPAQRFVLHTTYHYIVPGQAPRPNCWQQNENYNDAKERSPGFTG